MRESLLNKLCKCKHCGKAFRDGIEGDKDECDYCLAETELLKEEVHDKQQKSKRPKP